MQKRKRSWGIYDIWLKINQKLCKTCKICIDYRRKEDERRKKGELKDEWNWNGHLLRRKTDHVSIPAEIVCSIYEDSYMITCYKVVMSKGNSAYSFLVYQRRL